MTPNLDEKTLALFNDSYERSSINNALTSRFIELLLARPEMAEQFRHIEAARTRRTIITGMLTAMVAVTRQADIMDNLSRVAVHHGEIGVTAAHLDTWKSLLLQSARSTDPKFNADIEKAWNEVICISIDHMKQNIPPG